MRLAAARRAKSEWITASPSRSHWIKNAASNTDENAIRNLLRQCPIFGWRHMQLDLFSICWQADAVSSVIELLLATMEKQTLFETRRPALPHMGNYSMKVSIINVFVDCNIHMDTLTQF